MAADEVKVYDWDDEIEDDGNGGGDFVVLEPGTYDFEVHAFERGQYSPSANAKTPPCNMAIMTLKISTKDGVCFIRDNFPLANTMEWKASAFFRSIGLKKHGEKLRMKWAESVGCKGRAKIVKKPGTKDDVWFNNVGSYIDPPVEKGDDDEWS